MRLGFFVALVTIILNCPVAHPEELGVVWFEPEFEAQKSEAIVTFKVDLPPGTSLELRDEEIPIIDEKERIKTIKREEIIPPPPSDGAKSNAPENFTVDEQGHFEFKLKLPYAQVQLPLVLIDNQTKSEKPIIIDITVTEKKVSLLQAIGKKITPYFKDKLGLWLGVGATYMGMSESNSVTSTNLDTTQLYGPTFLFRFDYRLTSKFKMRFLYNQINATAQANNGLTLSTASFHRTITDIEGDYAVFARPMYQKRPGEIGVILALQNQSVPYFSRNTSSADVFSLDQYDIQYLALGPRYTQILSREIAFESFLRLQVPVHASAGVKAGVDFDGSIGLIWRKFKLPLGLYWYGQYQKYAVCAFDVPFATNTTGNVDIINTILELRIGYEL